MTAGLLLDDKNENDINSGGSEGASDNSVRVGCRYLTDKVHSWYEGGQANI